MPILTQTAVPLFPDVEAFQQALIAKKNHQPVDLYPRDNTELLFEVEAKAARLARVAPEEILVFNSGMSAVVAAFEVALLQSPAKNPVVAAAHQCYSQTNNYLSRTLVGRGIQVLRFDSNDPEDVRQVLRTHQPDVVFCETIGNGPDVPVLDIANLLAATHNQSNAPVIILDNTLPLSTCQPIGKNLAAEDRILVVESGTKSYTLNTELSGFLYSRNLDLLRLIRDYRRMTGAMPGLGSLEKIKQLLPATVKTFDQRNLALYAATQELARALFDEQSDDFRVVHPSLPSHPAYELAKTLYPSGGTPVLFLQCGNNDDKFRLMDKLWQYPGVRRHVGLGQSFGFDETRIQPEEISCCVRLAGGATTDVLALSNTFRQALSA